MQQGEEKQKGKPSTPYCCGMSITLRNTYFQACLWGQAQLCLKSRRLQRRPAPAGSSLHAGLAGAGTAGMCPAGRGDERWLVGRGHRARLPSTQPQRAGHREAEQGRVLHWHAAASAATAGTWLERGHANTCRRERRLFGHGTAALRSLCCSWGPAPGNVLAQRGKRDNRVFYLPRGQMCSVHSRPNGPQAAWSMSHFCLPRYLLPVGDDSKYCQSVRSHPPSQSLELLPWPSTLCIKYI